MKLLVLYKEGSEHRRKVEDFIREFRSGHPDAKIETEDVDRREGMAMASLYDVVRYPTVLALRDDGSVLQMWEGEELPLMDEVGYYALEQ